MGDDGQYLVCINNVNKEQYLALNEKYWTRNCCDDIVWVAIGEPGIKNLLTLNRSRFITLEEYRCINILEILNNEN